MSYLIARKNRTVVLEFNVLSQTPHNLPVDVTICFHALPPNCLIHPLHFSAMSKLTPSICWNILAHKTDEDSEVGVKIYQKPESNDLYELRRKKNPPLCSEKENPDAAW